VLAATSACQQAPKTERQADESAVQTFATVCARCHGSDGKGGVAPEGSNAPRNFCDAAFQASRSDEDLKHAIRKGKGAMPPFGNVFSDALLGGLVRKVRSFDPDGKRH
jgi:mono/diheme cytochrome c family protein